MKNPYDDIINLPRPISTKHPAMSLHDRAAQFSPFAALTGFGAAIIETARLTDSRVELDEYIKADLNARLAILKDQMNQQPKVSITYFQRDSLKAGGTYTTVSGRVKRIDEYEKVLVMQNAKNIPIDDILELEAELFDKLEHQE